MILSDVRTLKYSIFDFTVEDSKASLVKDAIGFLSYGVNDNWLFDMNQTEEIPVMFENPALAVKKLEAVFAVQKNKKFSAEYRNSSELVFTTKIDNLAVIELQENAEIPQNGTQVEFSESDGTAFMSYADSTGNTVSQKFEINNSENDDGTGIFSSGEFKTSVNLLNIFNYITNRDVYVLEKKDNKLFVSVSGILEIPAMRFSTLQNNQIQEFDVGEFKITESGRIFFCKRKVYTLSLIEKSRSKELSDLIDNGQITLCQIKNVSDTSLQVYVQQYDNKRSQQLFFNEMPVKLPKEYAEKIKQYENNIHIKINGTNYFVCQFADNGKNYVFTIYTPYFRIKVEKILAYGNRIDGNCYTLNVKSIEPRKEKNEIPNLSLVQGTIHFVDRDTEVNKEINQAIDSLIESKSSYLQTWDKYAELKGNELLARGRKFGVIYYESIAFDLDPKTEKKKVSITLTEKLPKNIRIQEKDSFDVYENLPDSENLPLYLKKDNFSMTWKDYYKATVGDDDDDEKREDEKLKDEINALAGKKNKKDSRERYGDRASVNGIIPVKEYNGGSSIRILEFYTDKPNFMFPERGHIVLSIYAEEIQVKRQEQARKMISGAKNAMPKLRVLLEDNIENLPAEKALKHVDLLPYFSQKIFGKYGPNETQLEAIYTALESPDITVIQGPPGTGKTTVICAILEMYNYLHNKKASNQGLYLLTSYQHDAVINLIDRLRLNGNPTFKFGKKSGEEENYNGNIIKYIEEIKQNQISSYIHEKYGIDVSEITNETYEKYSDEFYNSFDLGDASVLELLGEYYNEYCSSPIDSNKLALLEKLRDVQGISFEDNKLIQNLINTVRKPVSSEIYMPLLTYVRALRVNEASYKDDGINRAKELIQGHNGELVREILDQIVPDKAKGYFDILTNAANSINNSFNEFEELQKIQLLLLDFISEPPAYIKPQKDPQIIDLYKRVVDSCKRRPKNEKARILSDWIQTLDFNTAGIIEAIKKSDVAYSATAQQCVGKDITLEKAADKFSKSIGNEKDTFSYDVVVIDEAARATPPDLLIPMSRGKEKIILVGDHRQLPHMVDPNIAEKLLESEDADENDEFLTENTSKKNLEYSMFEILFNHLKKIEANGGVKRVVTLNKQYRMHPVLGKFASDQFYSPYGEGFDSPRPKSDFAHELPGIENKCAVWMDIPMSQDNKEIKAGNSLMRPAEAKAIIKKLLEWKTSPQGRDLTYGVITFYRGQADYLTELANQNKELAESIEHEEIRINTVDAFQGMEFDVVFLSVVRTSAGKNLEHKYGFLTSKNRLCVAFTRQKKVLVVCGDSGLLQLDDAHDKKKGIPELCAFYEELCNSKDDENGGDGCCL